MCECKFFRTFLQSLYHACRSAVETVYSINHCKLRKRKILVFRKVGSDLMKFFFLFFTLSPNT